MVVLGGLMKGSKAPIHLISKQKLIWLNNNRCRHAHTYLEHYNCYLTEKPEENRIGYFDIESSSLVADFGFCITWKILSSDGTMYGRTITKEEVLNQKEQPDYNLIKELVECLSNFDIIYTYYGTRFDFPFVRTRAMINNIAFPTFGSLRHKDVYYIVRNKFKLHRSRLAEACEFLLGKSNKTHWLGKYWTAAVQGNPEALAYIDEHCCFDVIDLKELTEKVLTYANPNTTKSI